MSEAQDNNKPPFPYRRYRNTYQILGGTTFILILLWLGSVFVGSNDTLLDGNALAYWTNVFTEILGVLVTIAVINQILMVREQSKLKKRLVRQAGSPSQAIATEAIAQLREEGWLTGEDGLLQGASLRGANLQGVDLTEANLRGTKLYQANLSYADLGKANLENADLRESNLSHARLGFASLIGAQLDSADMTEAIGWGTNFTQASLDSVMFTNSNSPMANFTDAKLQKANLEGSHLKNSIFVRTEIMGTNFAGCNLMGSGFENVGLGTVFAMMPQNQMYLTVLPDGRAIVPTNDVEAYIDEVTQADASLQYDNFVCIGDVDLAMYTNHHHPQYQNWKFDWNKANWKAQTTS